MAFPLSCPALQLRLKKVGTIRNTFAHRPEAKLEGKAVDELFQSLGAEDQAVVLESFSRTQNEVEDPFDGQFKDMAPKDKFTLLMVTIHALLDTAANEASERLGGT